MNIKEKRIFLKNIRRLDPNGNIVRIDLDRNEIRYNDSIKQHRKIRELSKEEIVRAYVVTKLITQLNYSKDCLELEKEHKIGRSTKKTSARIDILVKEKDNTYSTFMIIEVKAPDEYDKEMEEIKTQLFQVAKLEKGTQYLIYYTAYVSEDLNIKERVISVSFSRYDSYKDWEKEGKPNLMGIPKEYNLIIKPVFTKKGIPDLRTDIKREELETKRRELHNVLWGGGRYQGNEIFLFIMKLFLAKIYDEKITEDKKAYKFQIFYENGKSETPEKTAKRINELYQKALIKYLHHPESEAKSRNLRKIGDKKMIDPRKVKFVVEKFQDISITTNIYDVLGDFFERFLWYEFKQSKGQFFTHPNIVNFMVYALELGDLSIKKINEGGNLPYIIDPACGSGTFLIHAMKKITSSVLQSKDKLKSSQSVQEFIEREFPKPKKHAWAEKYIYGIDYNEDLALATKVNMVMHGDGSVNIESEDALSDFSKFMLHILKTKKDSTVVYPKPVNEQFDVILTNPPFSIELEKDTKDEFPDLYIYGKKKSSENLFIERWYHLLKPYGRLAAVVPESVLDTSENKYIRLFLFKYFWIKAIVSLPTLAFEPFTSTKTSLLFAQKKPNEEVEEYQKIWKKYEEEYEKVEKDLHKILKNVSKGLQLGLDETKEDVKKKMVYLLKRLVQDEFNDEDDKLSLEELKEKYSIFLKRGTQFKIDKDWWTFSKVSKELDHPILMADVKEIGFKRTVVGEKQRENHLFSTIKIGNKIKIVTNTKEPVAVLDFFRRDVKWEE